MAPIRTIFLEHSVDRSQPRDAISEFRMVSATIIRNMAEFRSGYKCCDQIRHKQPFMGTHFEFYRDPFLNTRNFFSKIPAVSIRTPLVLPLADQSGKSIHSSSSRTKEIDADSHKRAVSGHATVYDAAQLDPKNRLAARLLALQHPNDQFRPVQLTALSRLP